MQAKQVITAILPGIQQTSEQGLDDIMSERIRTQHQDSLRTNVINLSELLHKSVRVSVHADKEGNICL